ncbi:MAG: hypothetical protein ACKUBY_04830 [Candidatus Moraniibacteriota bacterium]|jgi:hypothetical protein
MNAQLPASFRKREKDYHATLFIDVNMGLNLPPDKKIHIICISTSRNCTTYNIFDENGDDMGTRQFDCMWGPVINSFSSSLMDDLEVLLEAFDKSLNREWFSDVTMVALRKCESRYGNPTSGDEDGDCIITIC